MHHIIKDFRTKNQTLWPAVWVRRVRNLPKRGFTNLTISRDLYGQLTAGARMHGDSGIPNYLTWLLSETRKKIGVSTVLRTDGVKNEVPFEIAESGGPGGIRTHDLRLRRPPSWSWLDYRP